MTSLVADMAERSTARSNSGVHASSITVPECGTKLAPFAVAVSAYFIAACLAAIVTAGWALAVAVAVTAAVASSTAANVAASTAKSTSRRRPGTV